MLRIEWGNINESERWICQAGKVISCPSLPGTSPFSEFKSCSLGDSSVVGKSAQLVTPMQVPFQPAEYLGKVIIDFREQEAAQGGKWISAGVWSAVNSLGLKDIRKFSLIKPVRKVGELGRVWETGCLPSHGANVSCLEASDAQPLPGRSEPRDDLLT